jgi:polar amino acid transport system substrate-binding protein
MKKIMFMTILLLSGFLPLSLAAETITIAGDLWVPYNADPKGPAPGFVIEAAKLIFGEQGYTVDYVIVPWSRAVTKTRDGSINAIVGAAKSDTPDLIFPANEQAVSESVFFVKKGSKWRYAGVDSLKTEKIGTILDYSYNEKNDKVLKMYAANIQAVAGETALEQNIKKLIFGRITVTIENRLVMQAKLKEMNMVGQVEDAGGEILSNPIYIAFSPANPKSGQYAKILSDGMTRIRKSGELKKILAKYGLKDWKKN